MYRFKAFNPKPFTPGARIYWDHTRTDGSVVRRLGVVWSGAPKAANRQAVWVNPEESLPDDLHRAICVVVPTDRDGRPPWSESYATHGPGWVMWNAERITREIRRGGASAAA